MTRLAPAALLAAAGIGAGAGPKAPATKSPPNIVLISIDTLRADRLHCYGNPRDTSPAIDALARDGVLFENAQSHAPKTATSHMSLFTGLLPPNHGVVDWEEPNPRRLDPRIPTLASLLSHAGYATAAFTGGGNVRAELGFDQGFDVYRAPGEILRTFRMAGDAMETYARPKAGAPRRPFFLFVHTYQVHDPYLPPESYLRHYADPAYAGRILSSRDALAAAAGGRTDFFSLSGAFWRRVNPLDPADLRQLLAIYDANVRYADDEITSLLARLQSLGLEGETLVAVLSDHGEQFHEHGGFLHDCLYQEILHVPLVLRFPTSMAGAPKGIRVPTVVGLVDVMPTLLELAGVEPPPGLAGRSLMPLLRGPAPGRAVFSQWALTGQAALRRGDVKYLRTREGERLYDLAADPAERRDLSAIEADSLPPMRAEVDRLILEGERWRATLGPQQPVAPDERTLEELRALGYVH